MTLPVLTGDRVASITRRLEMAVATVRSPFTGHAQAQDWGGRWWVYDLQLGPWRAGSYRPALGFLTGLEASAGRFLFEDPTARYTGGILAVGEPAVNGAGQTGRSLVTDGWSPGVVVPAGMCFSLNSDTFTRFHMVTADVIVSPGGQATLPIAPRLRESPSDNALINYAAPRVQLRIPAGVAASIVSGGYATFSLTAEEAL